MKKFSLEKMACIVITLCAMSGVAALAQTFKSVARFDRTDGAVPLGSLAQGADGDFYGITWAAPDARIFKVATGGSVSALYDFCPPTAPICYDVDPYAGLVLATDGKFYGATNATIFSITPAGKFTTVYSFSCNSGYSCPEGIGTFSGVLQATDGNFYGTTLSGGSSQCYSCGTIFQMAPEGMLTSLYSFCSQADCTDGIYPNALVQAADGSFYGTTEIGGSVSESCPSSTGCGTVFKITPKGVLTTLYNFCAQPECADGLVPFSALIQATNGNFYGTTSSAWNYGHGTIFEITPEGKLTTLYSFCSQPNSAGVCTDGEPPISALVQGTDGNFYGTTGYGGAYNSGSIFSITPAGTFTTLYSFCPEPNGDGVCSDGASPGTIWESPFQYGQPGGAGPGAALVQGTDGNFYGTTDYGGSSACSTGLGCGTVFRLSMGLAPFVRTLPTARAAGGNVTILGNNLTGTTSVTFNGTAATLITVSDTAITTTVPTGATTGTVQVVTPSGTLTSNVPFRVIP
jgi:uncharacterized repeat protein (TIGR03803 family)